MRQDGTAPASSTKPVPPRENCPDVEDCALDATEIGNICTFGPVCGTCVVYRPPAVVRGLLSGTCRLRPDRGTFPCTAPICDSYMPRQGAPDADGVVGPHRPVQLRTPEPTPARRTPAPAPVLRRRAPDGPVGVLEMTREELKNLIREAMDEERGGAEVALAPKWQGATVVIRPASGDLQPREIPVDALLHKIVMVRDRLRVLEQKINAHPHLSDAERVEMQAYITKCYGSLTTFNVLFRDRADQFQGEKSD